MVTPSESIAYQSKVSHAEEIDTGLCVNCLHNLNCTLKRHATHKIVACEEYDFEGGTNLKLHHTAKPESSAPDQLLGLCSNCDIRNECTLPKAEAGVWHCEEYV
ncbi:MAG: hypothetical protein K9N34_02835 [Candidatus Marinimicrobia bacterium]|nr:hypothetical protein [Candidatus Neomarinimicrobiota bacterium]MCF7839456.1 hypothetical protein [Candidatus Neomarinimicrobiota bacterium]MCF7901868.1 hypothetical protein [Candidatus Neomarinimicrobiota bacterium]